MPTDSTQASKSQWPSFFGSSHASAIRQCERVILWSNWYSKLQAFERDLMPSKTEALRIQTMLYRDKTLFFTSLLMQLRNQNQYEPYFNILLHTPNNSPSALIKTLEMKATQVKLASTQIEERLKQHYSFPCAFCIALIRIAVTEQPMMILGSSAFTEAVEKINTDSRLYWHPRLEEPWVINLFKTSTGVLALLIEYAVHQANGTMGLFLVSSGVNSLLLSGCLSLVFNTPLLKSLTEYEHTLFPLINIFPTLFYFSIFFCSSTYHTLTPELCAAYLFVMLTQWTVKALTSSNQSALKMLFSQVVSLGGSLWVFPTLWHFLFERLPTPTPTNHELLSSKFCELNPCSQVCCEAAASQLGIFSNASNGEIKTTARIKIRETHPDLHTKDTRLAFQNVLTARERLLNCNKGFKP